MKIMGFEVKKKHIIIVGGLAAMLFIGSQVSDYLKQQEVKERQEELQARLAAEKANQTAPKTDEQRRTERLEAKYGTPPDGFVWEDDGTLIPISDDKKTAEEVMYTYIRALSIEDFSTAQKYAKKSGAINKYNSYFDDASAKEADYYGIFLRKQYKLAMQSVELVSAEEESVQADGTVIISMKLRVLDLSNKDFWKQDAEKIYNDLRSYKQMEADSIKGNQYVYDYIYDAYAQGKVGKREVICNFKLTKKNGQGWLIRDDYELVHYLLYEEGVNVYEDIITHYREWYQAVKEKEQLERMQNR